MPLEVRQIGVRMNVPGAAGDGAERGGEHCGEGARISPRQRAALVEECTAAVLEALRLAGER